VLLITDIKKAARCYRLTALHCINQHLKLETRIPSRS